MPKDKRQIIYAILLSVVFVVLLFALLWAVSGLNRGAFTTKLIQ